jgi:hypothetical protein
MFGISSGRRGDDAEMDVLYATLDPSIRRLGETESAICVHGALGGRAIISQGWGSSGRTDTHLTYMIDIALNTEFSLAAGGAR